MNKQTIARGSCFCGAVSFACELPSKWCAHCHCSMCRKVHGAGYVTWVGFESSQVRIDDSQGQLQWFSSSPGARRGSCRTCSSSLFFEAERWSGETHVARACFDDPIDREPAAHAFHDTHVDWMALDDSLKAFSG